MNKAQRNGAGRRDPEKLKRQKRRDRLFLAFLTFLNFLLALIVRIADRKSVIKAVSDESPPTSSEITEKAGRKNVCSY